MATTTDNNKSTSKGQAWFCTTGLPSDIVVEVEDMTYHLHKFPLMSKSRKLHLLITEQETNNLTTSRRRRTKTNSAGSESELQEEEDKEKDEEEEYEEEVDAHYISLSEFPGTCETFEIAAKFCYGVKIEISSSNVAPLRCAAEYLQMTEDYSQDNLISKTESFLADSVFNNIKHCVKTLKSLTEKFIPMAENIQIIDRCIDAIVSRASSIDPSSLFGWPITTTDGSRSAPTPTSSSSNHQILWNGIETGGTTRRRVNTKTTDSWIDDLGQLSLPLYQRLISAMKDRDLSSDIIERAIISYAKKSIPGLSRSNRKQSSSTSSSSTVVSEVEQRELLETIITNLPLQNKSSGSSSTIVKFLFGLLRTANILSASEACRSTLEKKIASQLDQATLDDLLIPSYSYLIETLYDVDCIGRILGYFLKGLEVERSMIVIEDDDDDDIDGGGRSPTLNPLMLVGKLIDGYLSEIASDANLKPDKFCGLAVALPDQARLYDDGLYRAVDVYLKAHSWVTEEEKEKICGVMDCQKLTLEACTHAAQNERLPLRMIVQVLFFEQLQLRHAIAGSLLANELGSEYPRHSRIEQQGHQEEEEDEEGDRNPREGTVVASPQEWRVTIRENQVLRLDMDSMRSRVQELERECSTMKKTIEKMEKGSDGVDGGIGWRTSLTKKLGCKFKTQVCDSHEPTVVESRKTRHRRQTSSQN